MEQQYEVKVVTDGDFTLKIYKPILSASERAKREKNLTSVAERVYKGYLARKEKKKYDNYSN